MKTKLFSLLLALCLLAGCAPAANTPAPDVQSPDDSSICVIDANGRTVTLPEPARRVVALAPSDCEILFAIGAQDKLVGRGTYCDYPAQVLELPELTGGADINIEQIIALQPDLLLTSRDLKQTDEQIARLEAAGIPVVVSAATDIDGVYAVIEMLGELVGMQDNAAQLVASMQSAFASLAQRAAGDGSRSVYFEVSPLQWGLWTAGDKTFMNEIATLLGMTNCFYDVTSWAEISEEQVLQRDPDFIVTITMYYGEGPTPTEEILSRAGWENITAVKNGKVLNLTDDALSRPGPRLVQGAQSLYDFLYTE